MSTTFKKVLALTAILAVPVAGCASQGPTDNPVLRNMSWDRYVGGDDIFRACAPGQPDRIRLVYNARQDYQQKTYDFSAQPDGGAMLEARVVGRGNLNDPKTPISIRDPLGPWRGPQALYRLAPAEMAKVRAAMTAAGFEAPAPDGLFLRGDSFYWTASACREGKFHFHAWSYPSPEFDRMAVPMIEALAPYDKTGVEATKPYEIPLPPYSLLVNSDPRYHGGTMPHQYQVGKHGLRYSQGTLF